MFPGKEYYSANAKQAADAIEAYFGITSFTSGDVVMFWGDFEYDMYDKITTEFENVSGDNYVRGSSSAYYYADVDYEVTLSLTHAGAVKSIYFDADGSVEFSRDTSYDYKGKDYSAIQAGDPVTVTADYYDVSIRGYQDMTIGGTVYSLEQDAPADETYDTTVAYITANLITPSVTCPVSPSVNVTVENTYSAVNREYKDGIPDDGGNLILYGGVAAVAVVAALLLLFIYMKKRSA